MAPKTGIRLHQIATARQRTGKSLHSLARQLGITVAQLRATENEEHDVWVSELHLMSEALGVPVGELLVEPGLFSESAGIKPHDLAEVAQKIDELEKRVDTSAAKVLVRMLSEQIRQLRR